MPRSKLLLAAGAALALVLVVALVALFRGAPEPEGTSPAEPQAEAFEAGDEFSLTAEGVTYWTLTNEGKKAYRYLELKPTSNPKGSVTFERCSKAYDAKGACGGESLTVLPRVDLDGWGNFIAAANTTLAPGEKAYYKVTVSVEKGEEPAVTFDLKANSSKASEPKSSKK